MKLNELIGYKQDPIYQKATQMFKAKPVRYRDRDRNMSLFVDTVLKNGFRRMGGGTFGATFEKAGYPWVIKIFTHDPAYLYFIKYAIMHQGNPAVPKIKGKMMRINDITFAVRMEKLEHYQMRSNDRIDEYARLVRSIEKVEDLTEIEIKWIQHNFPNVFQVMADLDKSKFDFDLHQQNFMMRGQTVVLTDPLFDESTLTTEMNESGSRDGIINELVGYKNNPAHKAAVSRFSNDDTSPYDKVHKFTNDIKELGYSLDHKGAGGQGTVFKRYGDPYVIKVFYRDSNYLKYLKYVLAHQDNPHVPKVRGKPMKITPEAYAVRLEELQPVAPRDENEKQLVDSIINTLTWGRFKQNSYIRLEEPELYKMLLDLAKIYGDHNETDLIQANIMQRKDGTIVITDPA